MIFGAVGSLAIGAVPDRMVTQISSSGDSYVPGGAGSRWDDRFIYREPVDDIDKIPEEQMLAVLLAADEYFFE